MTLKEYAQQYNRPADNNFAVACYEKNTRQELREALSGDADATDCTAWGISAEEWRDAIAAALEAQDVDMWSTRADQPLVREGHVLGLRVNLEDTGDMLRAGFIDEKTVEDEMTIIIPGKTVSEGGETYKIPETTEANGEVYDRYFEALVTWVAQETGEDPEVLHEQYHPECYCPTLRWQRDYKEYNSEA